MRCARLADGQEVEEASSRRGRTSRRRAANGWSVKRGSLTNHRDENHRETRHRARTSALRWRCAALRCLSPMIKTAISRPLPCEHPASQIPFTLFGVSANKPWQPRFPSVRVNLTPQIGTRHDGHVDCMQHGRLRSFAVVRPLFRKHTTLHCTAICPLHKNKNANMSTREKNAMKSNVALRAAYAAVSPVELSASGAPSRLAGRRAQPKSTERARGRSRSSRRTRGGSGEKSAHARSSGTAVLCSPKGRGICPRMARWAASSGAAAAWYAPRGE